MSAPNFLARPRFPLRAVRLAGSLVWLVSAVTTAHAQGSEAARLADLRDASRRLEPATVIAQHNAQAWRMATLSFAEAARRLPTFAPYTQPPAVGRWTLLELRIPNDTTPVPYLLHIPAGYDATRPTPLLVSLHDAVARPDFAVTEDIDREDERMVRAAHAKGWLILWPLGNRRLNWVEHLASLKAVEAEIDAVRRQYNVDESRIWVGGLGDGGRGALWFATRNHNVAAATFHIATLPTIAVTGGTRMENAAGAAPLFAVSGATDALVTTATVQPFWQALAASHAPLVRVTVPGAGHELAAEWNNIAWVYDSLGATQRIVVPRTLQWSASTVDEGRRSWLTMSGLDTLMAPAPWHRQVLDSLAIAGAAPNANATAAVRAVVKGNLITIQTSRVTRLQVALVSTLINFKRPIRVIINDHEVYHAKITPSSGVMVQEFLRSLERTAPVGAVIDVDVRKRNAHVQRGD